MGKVPRNTPASREVSAAFCKHTTTTLGRESPGELALSARPVAHIGAGFRVSGSRLRVLVSGKSTVAVQVMRMPLRRSGEEAT